MLNMRKQKLTSAPLLYQSRSTEEQKIHYEFLVILAFPRTLMKNRGATPFSKVSALYRAWARGCP